MFLGKIYIGLYKPFSKNLIYIQYNVYYKNTIYIYYIYIGPTQCICNMKAVEFVVTCYTVVIWLKDATQRIL